MPEKIGVVVNSDEPGWAQVVTDRTSGCGGCHTGSSGCRTCLAGSKMVSRVSNAIGAEDGDLVKLSLPSAKVLKGAALLYLLPIGALIAGAFAGLWLGHQWAWTDTPSALVGGLVGLAIAILVVIRLGHKQSFIRQMTPVITSVIQQAGHGAPPHQEPCCQ